MSVLRRMMMDGFNINAIPSSRKIYYTASEKITPSENSLGSEVQLNMYNATTMSGVIVTKSDVTMIGDNSFSYCTSLKSITIPESVTEIKRYAFRSCTSLKSITIPNSVTEIGEYAFYGCTLLENVTIPDNVTSIGNNAFNSCRSLASIYITDLLAWCMIDFATLTANPLYEGKAALYLNGVKLVDITIPSNIKAIKNYAFNQYKSLTSVTIPDSVTSIGNCAFWSCTSLISVYCNATTSPTLGGSSVFDDNGSDRKIYVPMESVDVYKSATNWSEYADAIEGYEF